MPAVQHRLVSWRPSLLHRTTRNTAATTILSSNKLAATPCRHAAASACRSDEPTTKDEDDELELDDDEDDEDLVVFTAREAAGAFATIYGFVRPYLGNYKKLLPSSASASSSRRCSTSSCRSA